MDKMSKSGQDVTIAIVITVLIFLGSAAAFYQYFYITKLAEIDGLKSQRTSKEQTFNNYKKVIEEKLNYEEQMVALEKTWEDNKHYFINGLVDWTDVEDVRQTQFTIFQLYDKIIEAAFFAGMDFVWITMSESLTFHPDDEPYDFPITWRFMEENLEYIPSERFPDGDGGSGDSSSNSASGTGGAAGFSAGGGSTSGGSSSKSLFNSHDFSVEGEASYEMLKQFIEILQDLEGEETWVVSVHCFESSGDPLYRGAANLVLDIMVPFEMFCSAYELYELGPTNTPPSLPGSTACSPSGGGGSEGRGAGAGF